MRSGTWLWNSLRNRHTSPKLIDSMTGANNVLLSYVNMKIAEPDGRKQVKQIDELTVEVISLEQVNQTSGYLDTCFADKRRGG